MNPLRCLRCLTILIVAPIVNALHGANTGCCQLALDAPDPKPTLILSNGPNETRVCDQMYSPDKSPAAELAVYLWWCEENCNRYALYRPDEVSDWAIPLVSFILPAVIFSTQIPRRLGLRTVPMPRKWYICLATLPFLLILDAVIIIIDTTVWVFTIMIGSGSFIYSGLVELWLDYQMIQNVLGDQGTFPLDHQQRIDILTSVIAGNLLIPNTPADPQPAHVNPKAELKAPLAPILGFKRIQNSLLSMLESQTSFGAAVGAAIALYIGSYVYTLSTLGTTEGDSATARALAFGIWWMTIVHVSVVGGSLLASNNPSVASEIGGQRPLTLTWDDCHANADKPELGRIRKFCSAIHEYLGTKLCSYDTRYRPAWMWTRGQNKALWLYGVEDASVKDRVRLPWSTSCSIFVITYILVFAPCALAFWIEYRTPPVTVGCRSMTILLYMVAQTEFILYSAWSHFITLRETHWLSKLRESCVCNWFCICLLTTAGLLSVFTTFAGTLMQITGIFQNCRCAATFAWWYKSTSTVSLSTDTQAARDSSASWNAAGYSALGVLGLVTVGGWWFQRYIRDRFIDQVEALQEPETVDNEDTRAVNGA